MLVDVPEGDEVEAANGSIRDHRHEGDAFGAEPVEGDLGVLLKPGIEPSVARCDRKGAVPATDIEDTRSRFDESPNQVDASGHLSRRVRVLALVVAGVDLVVLGQNQ